MVAKMFTVAIFLLLTFVWTTDNENPNRKATFTPYGYYTDENLKTEYIKLNKNRMLSICKHHDDSCTKITCEALIFMDYVDVHENHIIKTLTDISNTFLNKVEKKEKVEAIKSDLETIKLSYKILIDKLCDSSNDSDLFDILDKYGKKIINLYKFLTHTLLKDYYEGK